MERYFVIDKNGKNQILIGDPTLYDVWCPITTDFDVENFDCYVIENSGYELSIDKLREKRKNQVRTQREILFKQLDVLYFIESEKIYRSGIFSQTTEMDEIMRKKAKIRDLPQQLDLLTTIEEIRNFVIPQSLNEL